MSWLSKTLRKIERPGSFARQVERFNPAAASMRERKTLGKGKFLGGNVKDFLAKTREAHRVTEDPSGRSERQYKEAHAKMKSGDPAVRAEGQAQFKALDKTAHRRAITQGELAVAAGAVLYGGEAALGGTSSGEAVAGGSTVGGGAGSTGSLGLEGTGAGAGGGVTESGASVLGGGATPGESLSRTFSSWGGDIGAATPTTSTSTGLFGTNVTSGQALAGLSAGEGVVSSVQGQKQAGAAKRAAAAADPFASQRAGYAAELAALSADPSSITSGEGYQTGLSAGEQALERQLAQSGQLGGGQEKIAMQGLGQSYTANIIQAEQQRLAALAGGGNAPTAFAGQMAYANAINQALASMGYGTTRTFAGARGGA